MAKQIKAQGLFLGTLLLLISNIIVKGLGFFYRVALVRLLGAEGIGLVEMVSPLFSFLIVLAGCGVQPALSQLIAGRGEAERQLYFRAAFFILLLGGSLVTLAALAFSPLLLRHFISDSRAALCFHTILPAIPIISIASAWRGCFQGMRRVSALGVSQNAEQAVRVAVGLWLTARLLAASLETAVAAASVATVCGELAGLLCLVWQMRHSGIRPLATSHTAGELLPAARRLLAYGLPTTAGRLIASAILMLQAFLIPYCLSRAGWDTRAVTEIYGRFSGVALSLLHLPGVFTAALTVSVLPAVAESMQDISSGRMLLQKRIHDSLQAAMVFTLPGMLLLWLYSDPLCTVLFDNAPAAIILRWLAPGGIFFYLQVTLASVLQGLGAVRTLLLNSILSGIILLFGIFWLTSQPTLGILGTALALDISWLTGFLLHLNACRRLTQIRLNWRDIAGKPLLATGVSLFIYHLAQPLLVQSILSPAAARLALCCLICGTYLLTLLISGGLHRLHR